MGRQARNSNNLTPVWYRVSKNNFGGRDVTIGISYLGLGVRRDKFGGDWIYYRLCK